MNDFWKYRPFFGFAKYKVVRDDNHIVTLEDTSCKDHDNCIVKVVEEGDHYVLSELVNDSAKRYGDYHVGNFYRSRKECLDAVVAKKTEEYDKKEDELKNSLSELNRKISKLKLRKPEYEVDLFYGKSVFYRDRFGNMCTKKMEYKVIGGDGQVHWYIADDGSKIDKVTSEIWTYDGNDVKPMNVLHLECVNTDDDGSEESYIVFSSTSDYDAHFAAIDYCSLKKKIELTENRLSDIRSSKNRLHELI